MNTTTRVKPERNCIRASVRRSVIVFRANIWIFRVRACISFKFVFFLFNNKMRIRVEYFVKSCVMVQDRLLKVRCFLLGMTRIVAYPLVIVYPLFVPLLCIIVRRCMSKCDTKREALLQKIVSLHLRVTQTDSLAWFMHILLIITLMIVLWLQLKTYWYWYWNWIIPIISSLPKGRRYIIYSNYPRIERNSCLQSYMW